MPRFTKECCVYKFYVLLGESRRQRCEGSFHPRTADLLGPLQGPMAGGDHTELCALACKVSLWLPPSAGDWRAFTAKPVDPEEIHRGMHWRGGHIFNQATTPCGSETAFWTGKIFQLAVKKRKPYLDFHFCRHSVAPWSWMKCL